MDADGDGGARPRRIGPFDAAADSQPGDDRGSIETGVAGGDGNALDSAFHVEPAVASQESGGPTMLSAGGEQMEMTTSGFADGNSQDQSTQLIDNLKQFDRDKNDYLDEREIRQFGQINFKALDANGDGKLYFDEIKKYVDAQAAAASVRLVVGVVDHDHAFFEAIDANRDGRLVRRELNRLVGRLKAWDRDGDGQLAFDEVPRRYTLTVGQDQPQLPFDDSFGATYSISQTVMFPSNSGPDWFTRMDRNSDGDVFCAANSWALRPSSAGSMPTAIS